MNRLLWIASGTAVLTVSVGCAVLGYYARQIDGRRPVEVYATVTPAAKQAEYPAYPFSVVIHGVRGRDEFEHAKLDPVVAAHYGALRVTARGYTNGTSFYYASYRVRDSVCWTRRKILIPEHEPVLVTDTDLMIRERCGNELSLTIHVPFGTIERERIATEAMGIADRELRRDPMPMLPEKPSIQAGNDGRESLWFGPSLGPTNTWAGGGGTASAAAIPVVAPEPKTFGLFVVAGGAFLAWRGVKVMRR